MPKILFLLIAHFLFLHSFGGQPESEMAEGETMIFDESLIWSKPKADYELQTRKAQAYLREGKIDSALNISSRLIQKAELGSFPPEKVVDAYKNMGGLLLQLGVSDLAHWYLDKALGVYFQHHFEPSSYLASLYSLLAANYIDYSKDPAYAINYSKRASLIYKNLDNHLFEASLINNIGYVYLVKNRLDSANFYFETANTILRENKVSRDELMLSINDNLGEVAFQKKQFEKAFGYYELNYQLAKEASDSTVIFHARIIACCIGKTKSSIALGEFDDCVDYLNEASNNLGFIKYKDQLERGVEIQELWGELYRQSNKMNAFAEAMATKFSLIEKKYKVELDAQSKVTDKLVELQLASFNLQLDANKKELALAQSEKRLNLAIGGGLFIVLSTVGVFLIILVRRRTLQRNTQRELVKVNLQNQRLEEEKMQLELHNQSKDLSELSAHNLLMRKIADEASKRLKAVKTLERDERDSELQSLSTLFTREVNTNKAQALIQSNLRKVNASFFKALDDAAGTHLSKKEKELCALFRLNLNDEQIAEIKLISVNAVQVARHRIKKKIGLSKQDDITVFLSSINHAS